MSLIRRTFRTGVPPGVLEDMTSVNLSSADGTFGVKRNDTDAVVVADGTAMTRISLGVYQYEFTDPAYGLTYTYSLEVTYGGETYWIEYTLTGPADSGGTDLYDLLPGVHIEVQSCPEVMQKEALRAAARQFCRDTEIWRETLTFDSVEDEPEYALNDEHSYDAEIYRILTVTLDEGTVEETARTFTTTGILEFDAAPTAAGDDIVVNTVLLPYETCAVYPAWLLRRWGEGIRAGTLARLKGQDKRPWTDQKGAAEQMTKYTYAAGQAKGMVLTGRESGDVHVQGRRFV